MNLEVASRLEGFRQRAAGRLRPEPPDVFDQHADARGDHTLDGLPVPGLGAAPGTPLALRPAAVLVPIVMREDGPTVLLTERASHLRTHSGQIAFPGGKMDPTDASPLATALREAEEEIGLTPDHVDPLGYLDPYLSSSNFFVVPAVALVSPGLILTLNADEVAAAFEVPLGFLMDEANHQLHSRELRGRYRQYYAMPFGSRYIWGVTAGILRNLYERVYRGDAAS